MRVKTITGYPGYQVTDQGDVIGKRFKTPLSIGTTSRGYGNVVLMLDGKRVNKSVHRLVAEAFIPNPDNLPEVNHKYGIKLDNRYTQIEWCTHSDNEKHAYRVLDKQLTGCATPRIAVISHNKQTGEELHFESIHDAARKLGLNHRCIWKPLHMGNVYGNDCRCDYRIRRAS